MEPVAAVLGVKAKRRHGGELASVKKGPGLEFEPRTLWL